MEVRVSSYYKWKNKTELTLNPWVSLNKIVQVEIISHLIINIYTILYFYKNTCVLYLYTLMHTYD